MPPPFAAAIAASYETHTQRAVELQAEASRIQRIMRENEIPAVFLKGAFLAFHIYRQPALRPMRDLDLLVELARHDAVNVCISITTLDTKLRAVMEPRSVLADFGVTLPETTRIRVWDSTAELRHLVIPMRPNGTDGWSADELASLVTRDSMIGTGLALDPDKVTR